MSIIAGYCKRGFDAYGEKVLRAEHMKNWMSMPERTDPQGVSFELGASIQEVEDGFFCLLPTLKELYILNPNCKLNMSDETIELFRKNQVLIRGDFDGNAEKLAKDYGLRFLHSNVKLAVVGDFDSRGGVNEITLRFDENGKAWIHQNINSKYGGGENTIDLQEDFYMSLAPSKIADKCWMDSGYEAAKEEISNKLQALFEVAKNKGGFFIDYRT